MKEGTQNFQPLMAMNPQYPIIMMARVIRTETIRCLGIYDTLGSEK